MRKICCNQCGKLLFTSAEKSDGATAAIAQNFGFVVKNAILFTGNPDFLFFCNNQCKTIYYQANVPKDEKTSGILTEMKSQIPKMAKECSKGIEGILSTFNKHLNGK